MVLNMVTYYMLLYINMATVYGYYMLLYVIFNYYNMLPSGKLTV